MGNVGRCQCGGSKQATHDVCTRCAWELGWDGVRLLPPPAAVDEPIRTELGEEVICLDCEFEAESIEHLAEHHRDGCR